MKKKEQKQCVICKQPILEDKDKWVRLTDFDCGTQTGEVFYHYECWHERFQITNSERKKQMYVQTMNAIRGIKNNLDRGGISIVQ